MNYFYLLENYWRSIENQRKFFIEFASQKGFDPLILENWDKMTTIGFRKQVRKKRRYGGLGRK